MLCFCLLASLLVSRLGLSLAAAEIEVIDTSCPTWTQFDNVSTECICGSDLNSIVHCDAKTLQTKVVDCYCMSYNEKDNQTIVGFSPYACDVHHRVMYSIPQSPSQLDSVICGPHNRTGQMCGSCQEGYAPPVYSYSLACVECSDYNYNWLKYLAIAYFPLTVFYFIVIFFRVNIFAPSWNAYVLVCQLVGTPLMLSLIQHYAYRNNKAILLTLFGFWNLDFVRFAYPPFCLHPNMTTLQALALDYAIAVYPMCLIVITYILFKLHFHYSAVVWLWTPFRRCFYYFRKEWDLSNSLVGAFCTFLLLSYVKILYVSFALLAPVRLHDINGAKLKDWYLLYDGSVQWFGVQHIPYAVLAIVMCLIFNILPLLLLFVYPCSCFQKCLNRFGLSFPMLHMFMDIFQGHYRPNRRYVAALYLALRVANSSLFFLGHIKYIYLSACGTLLTASAIAVAVLRPYKKMVYNILDVVLLFTIAHSASTYGLVELVHDTSIATRHWITLSNVVSTLVYFGILVPPLYGLGLLAYKLIPKCALHRIKQLFAHLKGKLRKTEADSEPFNIPYQIEHSSEYTPLIPNNEQ